MGLIKRTSLMSGSVALKQKVFLVPIYIFLLFTPKMIICTKIFDTADTRNSVVEPIERLSSHLAKLPVFVAWQGRGLKKTLF